MNADQVYFEGHAFCISLSFRNHNVHISIHYKILCTEGLVLVLDKLVKYLDKQSSHVM